MADLSCGVIFADVLVCIGIVEGNANRGIDGLARNSTKAVVGVIFL